MTPRKSFSMLPVMTALAVSLGAALPYYPGHGPGNRRVPANSRTLSPPHTPQGEPPPPDDAPFKDSRGVEYVRDAKGTIRRLKPKKKKH